MTAQLLHRVFGFALVFGCVGSPLAGQDPEYGPDLERAEQKMLAGELRSAEAALDEILLAFEEEPEGSRPLPVTVHTARLHFCEIDRRRGDYQEALEGLAKLPEGFRATRPPTLLRARILGRIGRHAEAIELLNRLVAADEADLEARYELGAVQWRAGRREAARAAWQANVATERPEAALPLAYLGRSLWRLGGRDNLELASQVLVASVKADPERPEARTTFGILKFEAYGEAAGFPSGEKDLKEVLDDHGDHEPALLAMYRIRSANPVLDPSKTERFLERALRQNPRCVEALTMRGSNRIDDRRFEASREWFEKALAVDPTDQQALSHLATVAWLQQDMDEYGRLRARALAGDPGQPEPDCILGDHLVALYRFADSLPFYENALHLDAEHIPALHGMARALIYCGDGAGARQRLELAKKLAKGINDPWRNNALAAQDLLDAEYTTIESGPFRLVLHRDDAEVLATYLMPIQLEAAETLGARYGLVPEGQVTVEVLHTWDDFSVRTVGFRGFTALGACFGKFVTLVSPRDGDVRRQDFMWEATAWHEYTHVLTLGLSKHRVPRWLTEGFSVYEEKVRDRTWERGMDRELFDAWHSDDLPPIHLLNRLFRGPRILFGYYQGGLVVDLIVRRHGFDKAVALLKAFGEDLGLEAACQQALGMSSRQLDAQFRDYVENERLRGMRLVPRYNARGISRLLARAGRDREDLDARVSLAWAFLQQDNPVDAGRWLAEALRVDPQHAPAMLVRAQMLAQRKESAEAIALWQRAFAAGVEDFDSRIRCGDAMLALGDADGAEEQWQRAKACWPGCTEQATAPELRLASLYRERGDRDRALMEMKAFCQRTARAFAPRMTLAEFERENGNRLAEARYLEQCNRIDPFHRGLHVRLGEAREALGDLARAAREFEMAAAVSMELDRDVALGNGTHTERSASDEAEERGQLWLRAARIRAQLGDQEKVAELVARILRDAPGSKAADGARELKK